MHTDWAHSLQVIEELILLHGFRQKSNKSHAKVELPYKSSHHRAHGVFFGILWTQWVTIVKRHGRSILRNNSQRGSRWGQKFRDRRSRDFCPHRRPSGELIAQYRPPVSFCFYPTLYLGNHLYFFKAWQFLKTAKEYMNLGDRQRPLN